MLDQRRIFGLASVAALGLASCSMQESNGSGLSASELTGEVSVLSDGEEEILLEGDWLYNAATSVPGSSLALVTVRRGVVVNTPSRRFTNGTTYGMLFIQPPEFGQPPELGTVFIGGRPGGDFVCPGPRSVGGLPAADFRWIDVCIAPKGTGGMPGGDFECTNPVWIGGRPGGDFDCTDPEGTGGMPGGDFDCTDPEGTGGMPGGDFDCTDPEGTGGMPGGDFDCTDPEGTGGMPGGDFVCPGVAGWFPGVVRPGDHGGEPSPPAVEPVMPTVTVVDGVGVVALTAADGRRFTLRSTHSVAVTADP